MDSEMVPLSAGLAPRCQCGCSCCSVSGSSGTWLRSVKRKFDEVEQKRFYIPGLVYDSVAKVQMENEIVALREMVGSQQLAVQDLLSELEEERNASSSAANEAMSMILKLQREKAEVQMEARQFKRLAEEKMGHDQQEIAILEDLLFKREQAIQSLTCEVQAYKHRMMSYGLTEEEADGEMSRGRSKSIGDGTESAYDLPMYEYPPLRCNINDNPGDEGEEDVVDIEKYAFGETLRDHLKNLEQRIYQMERNPSNVPFNGESPRTKNIQEKIIVSQSPRRPRHSRRFSADSSNSFFGNGRDIGSDLPSESPRFTNASYKKMDYVSHSEEYSKLRKMNDISEIGDDMSDRIYTVDSVQTGVPNCKASIGICDDYITTPRDSWTQADFGDPDVKKLYARLQALEADRESMRHTIMSMQTDKAQIMLLKEIAQHLCKDGPSERSTPAKKTPTPGKFSIGSVFKWMGSFMFWRKRARQSKYMFGLSPQNVGLLMIVDKNAQKRQQPRKLLTKTITKARA